MRRPKTAVISPDYFESGEIGRQTSSPDGYFRTVNETTLKIVVDHFVQRLPPNHRAAVEMCVMQGWSYAYAAERFTEQRGIKTDPKTVWRWSQKGVEQLTQMFANAKWAASIEPKMEVDE